jgi:glutamine amidotransferase PdxT
MRVAVAGTCGLALSIAQEINDETSHQLVILSRTVSANAPLKVHRSFEKHYVLIIHLSINRP